MSQRLLLLLPSSTYRTDAFIEASRRLPGGVDIVTATDRDLALPDDGPRGALSLPFHPIDDAVTTLVAYARRHPLHAVIGVDDHAQLLASRIAEALDLPYSPAAAVAGTLDKLAQARTLAAAGLPVPRTLHRPVVKPRSGRASRGVVRLDPSVLVQEYIPWSAEVAVEGLLTGDGFRTLAIFDKPDPLEGPFFEETVYVTPSRVGSDGDLAALASDACAALGLTHGPVHVELRLDDQGAAWLIEVNPRSIGGRCSTVLRFRDGLTLEDLILRTALGLSLPPEQTALTSAAAVAMVPVPCAGQLEAVHGIAAAAQVPGVCGVEIMAPLGSEVLPLPEGDRYLGFVTGFAPTPGEAEAAVREAMALLKVQVTSP